MAQRVLIVGAGPGGLAAAMLLSKAGLDVKVIERLPRVGGRTSSIESQGFRFDVGPTFFLYPQILAKIFAATGYNLYEEVDLIRLDPQYRLVFGGGGDLLATPNVSRMENAIARLSPQDALSFQRFMADNRVKLERFKPVLESPILGWRDILTPQMMQLLPLLKPWRSLDRELQQYFTDPRIRLALSFQSKYLGMSPAKCPSLFSILSFLEYEYGVFHPVGGCSAITETMARLATNLGVDIALHEPVEEILFDGQRATGVRTSAGEYQADAMILNADFAHAMTHLVPNAKRRRWTNRRLGRKRYSCSTFMLYLGLEGCDTDLPHHTIYMSRDYVQNLNDIEQRHVLSDDPSFYVQNASVTDPTLAPPGMSTLYVLVPVTHQHPNVDWRREQKRYREVALQQLRRIGLQDVEKTHSIRTHDDPSRLGGGLLDFPRGHVQLSSQPAADASLPTPKSL